MDRILAALNRLVADRVIDTYAIGGAIGASFYIDALQTEDVDAFTVLPEQGAGLISLASVYEALICLEASLSGSSYVLVNGLCRS